jgi:DNA-binding transcriptional MocR family regulator
MKIKLVDAVDQPLYEQVANRMRGLMAEGTLKMGDRLPSVRKLHQQLSVSISTVLEAYRILEDEGLIEARPQSGYFVKRIQWQRPEEPNQLVLPKSTYPMEVSLAFRVSHEMRDPTKIQLGAAVPGIELLPIAGLNRLMSQVTRAQAALAHSYHISKGYEQLRYEVAKRLMDAGCSMNPEEIVITNGTAEAIFLCLRAITQPGDTVAIESPTYYGFLETLESLHLKALEIPTHPKDGIVLEHLEVALAQRQIAACLLVSNFSNPLGSSLSDLKKKQLLQLLDRYDVPLVEDDIYGELYFEGTRPKVVKAFDTRGSVLYCASVSKTLSPGIRVGWCVPGRHQTKVETLKMAMNWTTTMPCQLTVAAFLGTGGYDRHLRQLRRAYQSQINNMTQAIYEWFPAETKVSRPAGGYVLWLQLPDEFDSMQLYEAALQHGISIAPGIMFSPSGTYRNCLRLNAGIVWTEQVHQAVKTVGFLAKQQLDT